MSPFDANEKPKAIDTQPRPQATRLNRVAVLGLACIGILILWIALFVLRRSSVIQGEAQQPAPTTRQALNLDRLERQAVRPAPTAPRPPRRTSFPPPPAPTPRSAPYRGTAGTATDPAAIRSQRALDASPLVTAFESAATYAAGAPTRGAQTTGRPPGDLPYFPGIASAEETSDHEPDPQLLRRKEEFLADARNREQPPTLPALLLEPLSPFTLMEGSLIPATLTAGINSDLPGQTQALVRQDVYDSVTGRFLLVPRGSRLIGSYDHRIAWGQKRVLIAWERLIFPDGSSLDLKGMPGADLAGVAGIRDNVQNHFVRTFGSALLLSAFSAGAQLSQPQESSNFGEAASARQIVAAALAQEINRTATMILRRNLDIAPTLEIRPGYTFAVQLTADLVLPHAYRTTGG